MLAVTNICENTQFAKFAKYNSTLKFVDLQYQRTPGDERLTFVGFKPLLLNEYQKCNMFLMHDESMNVRSELHKLLMVDNGHGKS